MQQWLKHFAPALQEHQVEGQRQQPVLEAGFGVGYWAIVLPWEGVTASPQGAQDVPSLHAAVAVDPASGGPLLCGCCCRHRWCPNTDGKQPRAIFTVCEQRFGSEDTQDVRTRCSLGLALTPPALAACFYSFRRSKTRRLWTKSWRRWTAMETQSVTSRNL